MQGTPITNNSESLVLLLHPFSGWITVPFAWSSVLQSRRELRYAEIIPLPGGRSRTRHCWPPASGPALHFCFVHGPLLPSSCIPGWDARADLPGWPAQIPETTTVSCTSNQLLPEKKNNLHPKGSQRWVTNRTCYLLNAKLKVLY